MSALRRLPLCLLLAPAACEDPNAAHLLPGVNIESHGLVDTVGAGPWLVAALVLDSSRLPVANVAVVFTVGPGTGVSPLPVYVGPVGGQAPNVSATDTTDSRGRAFAWLFRGAATGNDSLYASATVPSPGGGAFVNFVEVRTLPGLPGGVRVSPVDTAVYQGNSVSYHLTVVDKYGNPRTEDAQLQAGSSGVSVTADTARATAGPSRQFVLGRYGAFVDTAWLSVVPRGTIAVNIRRYGHPDYDYVIASFELDGSNYHRFLERGPYGTVDANMGLQWSPSGDGLYFFDGPEGRQLYFTNTSGEAAPLFPRVTEKDMWPQVNLAGDWIYWEGEAGSVQLYRSRLDGSEAARISPDSSYGGLDLYPSPAPDGTRLVYATNRDVGGLDYTLRILNLTTREFTNTGIVGSMPRWSPTGELIAFIRGHQLYVVLPNGTAERKLSPPATYVEAPPSWSPDGQYLVVERGGPFIDVFVVATGERLPLNFTPYLTAPAWRP